MNTTTPLLLGLIMTSLVFAGCIGADEPQTQAPGHTPAPTAQATDTTGSITGQVASTDIDLLSAASVFLHIGDEIRTAITDTSGTYTFNEVLPGKYTLDVTRVGYQNQRTSVEVVAGEVTKRSFQLQPLVTLDPFHETIEFVGFYDCAFGAPFITDTCTFAIRTAYDAYVEETGELPPFPRDAQNNLNTFYWTVGPGLTAVMSEMVWQDVAEATDEMMMLLSSTPIDNACDCSAEDYIDYTGPSPARALVGRDLPDTYGSDIAIMGPEQSAALFNALDTAENGTLEIASRGFLPFDTSFAYGQKFTIYVTAFYHGAPEPGFTAIPDQ